jgi:cell division protein FtsQ
MRPGSNQNRPIVWEDEAPLEPRFRRVQQGVPPTGRMLPGMPLEMTDPDGDDSSHQGGPRLGGPRKPWWRPASTAGRVFLGLFALIVLGGLTTGVVLLKTAIERDARFRIAGAGNIEATGLTQVSRAEMLPVFGEDIGRNIFFVDLAERRRQLEEIPWVERATVMRMLPDQIRVSVVERQPVAFARQGQQFGLVDANGILLAMAPSSMAQNHYSFPTLSGIDPRDPLVSRKARMEVYLRLLGELDSNGQKLSAQISEIDLTDPEDARIRMQDDDTLLHFGEDHFLDRYRRYKAHIAEWRQQYPKLTAVDLRYDQQVVLEMAKGTNAVEATVGGEAASDENGSKPATGEPAEKPQSEPNPDLTGNATTGNPASGDQAPAKPIAHANAGNTGTKASGKGSAKPKVNQAKEKAAKEKAARNKKRAEAQRAALNTNKEKPSPATHPAAVTRQGQ